MSDDHEGPGNRVLNAEEARKAWGERKPWSRVIEVRLGEEEIMALARFISEEHAGWMQDDEAVRVLVREGLVARRLLRASR